MREVCSLIWFALVGAFRSRASLEAENMVLRHQLNVLQRKSSKRPTFGMLDRLIFAGLYRLAPKVFGALEKCFGPHVRASYQVSRRLWAVPMVRFVIDDK